MKKIMFLCLSLLGVATFAQNENQTTGSFEYQKGDFFVRASPIPISLSSDEEKKIAIEPNLYLGIEGFINKKISLGFEGHLSSLRNSGLYRTGVYSNYWIGNETKRLKPFVGLGLDMTNYSSIQNINSSNRRTNFDLNFRLGLNYMISKRFSLGLLTKVTNVGYSSVSNQNWKLGVIPVFTLGFKF